MTELNMRSLQLVAEDICGSCGGDGLNQGEAWDDFHRWADQQTMWPPRGTAERMARAAEYFVDVRGWDAVPEMSKACPDCEGGVRRFVVATTELRDWILEEAPEALITTAEVRAIAEDVKATLTAAAAQSRGLVAQDAGETRDALRMVQEAAAALEGVNRLAERPGA